MKGVFVPDWQVPKSCAACPFFKVKVANGNEDTHLLCGYRKVRYEKYEIKKLSEGRADDCKLFDLEL